MQCVSLNSDAHFLFTPRLAHSYRNRRSSPLQGCHLPAHLKGSQAVKPHFDDASSRSHNMLNNTTRVVLATAR